MKLIQAKLRGTGPLIESDWFELSTRLNHFYFTDQERGTLFLRALQSLHPTTSCKITDPFKELPHYEKKGIHTKHIQPAKRSIALGVFGTTAKLVRELGLLDQTLYETDRIEIGRRLDYSSWLNFVELSSATRWKEIEADVKEILQPLQQKSDKHNNLFNKIGELKGPTRVKDTLAHDLLSLLDLVEDSQKNTIHFAEVVSLIKRAAHFQAAKITVLQRLPFLIYFNRVGEIAPPVAKNQPHSGDDHQELLQLTQQAGLDSSFSSTKENQHKLSVLEKIKVGIRLSLAVSKSLQRMDPIFLFDAPECNIDPAEHRELRHLIQETSQSQQCFYLSSTKEFFQQTETAKSYSCSQMQLIKE